MKSVKKRLAELSEMEVGRQSLYLQDGHPPGVCVCQAGTYREYAVSVW
jgi:hypothetical protein